MLGKNPWIGLASYDEVFVRNGYMFCGRQNSINELFAKVDNNIFTTIYGKSGIGKTSLIQAGLFPKLRANGYFPVIIRLGLSGGGSYARYLIDILKETVIQSGGSYDDRGFDCNPDDTLYLYRFFQSVGFYSRNGQILFPVIVLDQFEELFFRSIGDVWLLLRQLYVLIDDSALSDALDDSEYTNYRILLSLREDDLFRLEDSVDKLRLQEMKYNRYRLVELSDDEARDVILDPGRTLWMQEDSGQISRLIVSQSRSEDGTINTGMLSLICSRLYESAIKDRVEQISYGYVHSFLKSSTGNYLSSFYSEIKKLLNDPAKWYYIEDALMTDDGRRKAVPENDFLKHVPDSDFLFEGEYSMLRYVTISTRRERQVEIIHDTLAKSMLGSRNERHLAEAAMKQRRKNRITMAAVLLVLGIMTVMGYQFVKIKNTQNQLYSAQSRYLTAEADKYIEHGGITKAIRLLLHALPKNLDRKDRPYVEEAAIKLYDALSYEGTSYEDINIDNRPFIGIAGFALLGDTLVTSTLRKDSSIIELFDINTCKTVRSMEIDGYALSLAFYDDFERYAYVCHEFGSGSDASYSVKVCCCKDGELLYEKKGIQERPHVALYKDKVLITTRYGIEAVNYIDQDEKGLSFRFDSAIFSGIVSQAGGLLAIALGNDRVILFDADAWRIVKEYKCPDVSRICLGADNRMALVSKKNEVSVIDIFSGGTVNRISCESKVNDVSLNYSEDCLAIAMSDGSAIVWDLMSGLTSLLKDMDSSAWGEGINWIEYLDDGRIMTSAMTGYKLWTLTDKVSLSKSLDINEEILSIAYDSVNNRLLAVAGSECHVLNAEDLSVYRSFDCGGEVFSVELSPDCRHALISCTDSVDCISVYDIDTGVLELNINDVSESDNSVYTVDGESIITGGHDGKVIFMDARTGEIYREVQTPSDYVFKVDASSDGQFILAYDDFISTVTLIPVDYSGEENLVYLKHPDNVISAVFTPDGSKVITISDDERIRVWNARSGKMSDSYKAGYHEVIAVSADGRYLVGDNDYNGVTAYDLDNDAAIVYMSSHHDNMLNSVCLSPDASHVITAASDGIKRLKFDPLPLQEILDNYHNDPERDWSLTDYEKRSYYL